MKISTNYNANGVGAPVPAKRPAAPASASGETVSFVSSSELESALNLTPNSRPDAVARARSLLGDAAYPTPDTLKKISELLATKSGAGEE